MKVFWSWQNDYEPKANRQFIRDALAEAVQQAGEELGLEDADRPELDHDTKGEAGMTEITNAIFRKISESAVFVADLTPIGETDEGKALPNPNVLIELGWALSELGAERIIAIVNTASGYTPDDLPFDIRHRRALPYELAPNANRTDRKAARKKLTTDLTEALKTNLGQYVADEAAQARFEGVAAKEDDPSIWASCTGTIEYVDTSNSDSAVTIPDGPRGFIRIIPSGWQNNVPPVSAIQNANSDEEVRPFPESGSGGDFGPCEEGFVRFWITGDQESRNVSMWFDQTGEFWVIHGTVIADWKNDKSMLRVDALLRGWRQNLRGAMKVLDRFGAYPTRKVEAGVVRIKGVMWPTQYLLESAPARKKQTIIERQQRDWSEEAQLEFLTDAYNEIRDNFALPHVEQSDLKKITEN